MAQKEISQVKDETVDQEHKIIEKEKNSHGEIIKKKKHHHHKHHNHK